jgi:hypothetical protein
MPHDETQFPIAVTEISDLNPISPAHRVIEVIYTVLRGNRFAAQT